MDNKKTDNYTFYVMPGGLTSVQVSDLFKKSLFQMKSRHGVDYTHSRFYIKIIPGKSEGRNYGYLRVTDSGLYNCIIGKNPDGSNREQVQVKSISDYQIQPPFGIKGSREEADFDALEPDEQFQVVSDFYRGLGADYDDRVFNSYMSNTVDLEPLFNFEIHESGTHVCIEPAYVFIDPHRVNNEIYVHNVPQNITPAKLKAFFKPFNTMASSIIRTDINNVKCVEDYPLVNVVLRDRSRSRDMLLVFNPRSNDGKFALLVQKRCVIDGSELFFDLPTERETQFAHNKRSEQLGCLGQVVARK